jgi:hypothetical protein
MLFYSDVISPVSCMTLSPSLYWPRRKLKHKKQCLEAYTLCYARFYGLVLRHRNDVTFLINFLITLLIHSSVALRPFVGPWPRFVIFLYRVCRTPWKSDQSVARPPPTHRTTHTRNKRTQTSMPCVRFEPTIPAFERAKTVHALDRAASVITF